MSPLPSQDNQVLGSASSPLNGRYRFALQSAAVPALAAAAAEDDRRRAEQERQKASRQRRRREWDDAIRPLREWADATDVLLTAALLTRGLFRRGRGRPRTRG
jgi:hypothetical protein